MTRDFSPQEAADRWVDLQRTDHAEASISSLHYRLKQFIEYCERNDIETLSNLTPWDVDDFEAERRSELNTVSLNNQLGTVKNWLEWCETRGLVDERVVKSIEPPTVSKAEKSSDIKFAAEDALPQIRWFRDNDRYGRRGHAILEIMWHIGCRLGAVRGLDLRDFVTDEETGESYLDFRHRPESGTPLKNQKDGERPVGLRPAVADVIKKYIAGPRNRRRDDHGRDPLFTTQYGRISTNSVRVACYFSTAPCWRTACPHDRKDQDCEWWNNDGISTCPSTRSPHQVRTGSISWQLDQGVPLEVVSKRANASPGVIKDHYDKSDPLEEMQKRRRPHLDKLDIPTEDEQ